MYRWLSVFCCCAQSKPSLHERPREQPEPFQIDIAVITVHCRSWDAMTWQAMACTFGHQAARVLATNIS